MVAAPDAHWRRHALVAEHRTGLLGARRTGRVQLMQGTRPRAGQGVGNLPQHEERRGIHAPWGYLA